MTYLFIAAVKRSSYSTHAAGSLEQVERAALQAAGLSAKQVDYRTESFTAAVRHLQTDSQVVLWEQNSQPRSLNADALGTIEQALVQASVSRANQDEFALAAESQAYAGWSNGWFKQEVVGEQMDTTIAANIGYQVLATFQPIAPHGTITLGNAEPPAGGAVVAVLVNEAILDRIRQLNPLARINKWADDLTKLQADLREQEAIELAWPTAGQNLLVQEEHQISSAQLNPSGGLLALGYLQDNLLLSAAAELTNDLVQLNAGAGIAAGQGGALSLRRVKL
ncbi:MAG: hypothetical protein LKG31_00725 [Lactobacillus sp.]|jgi:acetyl-CoA acetyltransferase|nr:hypothetical protein [Lactobacillus sp.]